MKRARELGPLAVQSSLDYALALLAADDREQGLSEFRKALQRFPHSARIHFHAGSAYFRHGIVDEGLAEQGGRAAGA
jgi:tetratricopeptide (TPR) repeat protein